MRVGQVLFSILFVLILLATLGFVDWSAVGGWFKIMIYLFVAGVIVLSLGILFAKDDKKQL